ncbi:MAG TPA: alanine racemase [bacterium]|nr:alanine racemase [bacterium]
MTMTAGQYQWLELSRSAYAANIGFFRRLLGDRARLAVVVKANGYGHGIVETAGLARECGITQFCVHTIDEAAALRHAGFIEPILLLGPVPIARCSEVPALGVDCVAYNEEHLAALEAAARDAGKTVKVHLKVETGTNRQGVSAERLASFIATLKRSPHLALAAVYSHFANIEDTTNHTYAMHQLDRFNELCDAVKNAGIPAFERHLASSAATILFPKTHFDMVRVGIAQYGLWPSKETYLSYLTANGTGADHSLRPVLSWKTRIAQLKTLHSGEYIGYGCTYQTTRESRIAILPIGYSDGYDRKLSNAGYALVGGQRAPIRGRIAMNLTVLDVTDIPGVRLEDEVVLLGRQGDQEIKAETLAELAGTINYEIVSRIAGHIPRFVTE